MKPGMIGRGIAAGFVATVVLSAMMLVKHSMGLMPELDPIAMITAMAGANSPALGWIAHFVIGSVFWGIGFAVVSPYLPGPFWLRGVISLNLLKRRTRWHSMACTEQGLVGMATNGASGWREPHALVA